jgi:mRNA interferase RelE/StbE
MYELVYSQTAKRQLEKLDHQVRQRIVAALERIRIRPGAYVTRLVGDPGYKFRVGDYRVLLDIEHGRLLVLVLKAGHRSTIYDEVPALARARGIAKGATWEGIREKQSR